MESQIEEILNQAVAEVVVKEEVEKLLHQKPSLNVKLGIDPTSPEIHLGHALPLQKLKQFQDLGHQTYLVIGDFTATIGDPAGKNKTRPSLTEAEVHSNMEGYLEQAGKIIDLEKTHIVYNSEWLKPLTLSKLIEYAMQVSVTQLIEREDFAKRFQEQSPVFLHELIYPLVQAIDSVHLKADIELGGWDQRLNFLTARELQKKLGQPPQGIIMMKPLLGLDGVRKMSKTYGNFIALTDSADQMFGKIMSIPDELITNYAELAAWMSEEEIRSLDRRHPREAKADVAEATVARYYGASAATESRQRFDRTFKEKKPDGTLREVVQFDDKEVTLVQAVTQSLKESSSQAQRLITQQAVRVNGTVKIDPREKIQLHKEPIRMQIGKHRFFELRCK